jgi:stalled ribosome alternative rescue factor ArfA
MTGHGAGQSSCKSDTQVAAKKRDDSFDHHVEQEAWVQKRKTKGSYMRTFRVAIAATIEGGAKFSASVELLKNLMSTWPRSLGCPLEIETSQEELEEWHNCWH